MKSSVELDPPPSGEIVNFVCKHIMSLTFRLLRGAGAAALGRQGHHRCKATSTALEDTKTKKKQQEARAKRGGMLTEEEEDCGTPEMPVYFKDPDREKRMISKLGNYNISGRREANYTKGNLWVFFHNSM